MVGVGMTGGDTGGAVSMPVGAFVVIVGGDVRIISVGMGVGSLLVITLLSMGVGASVVVVVGLLGA